MLKETLHQFQQVETSPDFQENCRIADGLFSEFLAYMLNKQEFPNQNINLLTQFVLNLFRDEHISLVAFKKKDFYDHLMLFVDREGMKETPCLYIPKCFVEDVAETPEQQIGIIASVMSQCRDYFCGKYNAQNSKNTQIRALAYQAEALNTLVKLAKEEKVVLNLSDFQIGLLSEFPNGLADLEEWLWYPDPKYQETFSPPLYNFLYNPSRN
jgi:hypothetical protein